MKLVTGAAPHIQQARTVKAIMREVVLALIPAALLHTWYFGPGIVVNFLLAGAFALLAESFILRLRKRTPAPFIGDYSAIVTAALLAFALPPVTPWWVTAVAALFAIVVAKQLYGGLGFNTFNPAMAGYAVVLVSFPGELAMWTHPGTTMIDAPQLSWLQSLAATFAGTLPEAVSWDQITGATPLDRLQIGLSNGEMLSEIFAEPALTAYGARHWIMINLAIAAGGLWLLYRKIITWHIPVALLSALFIAATVFRIGNADAFATPGFHLLSGSAMMAAFFIATDPVSAATSKKGRIIYAAGIGVLIYVIRAWGSYPDGVSFAVLLLNMFVPLIDYFYVPRTYGHTR